MGMSCEVNSILKLSARQGYPNNLNLDEIYSADKKGYRIYLVDVPILLVDENWMAYADVIIQKLTWVAERTHVEFRIDRIYENGFLTKS